MKIAVMGAGALGGYFGGRMAAAGHEVWLIARGAHLAAIRENGLRIKSQLGDLHLPDIPATDDPGEVGPVDLVMFMVKNYSVEASAEAIRPMIGPETMVITCQNGVTAHERLGAVIGAGHVLPGVVRMPASIPEPGVILHPATFDRLAFGEADGTLSPRVKALKAVLDEVPGISVEVPENMLHDLWAKFMMQASFASLTALTRLNLGDLRDNDAARELFLRSVAETEAVGHAVVPGLPEGLAEVGWKILGQLPPGTHASMLDDLNHGKRLENDWLSGDVVRLGAKHGVPTPIHSVFHALLAPLAMPMAG